MRRSLDGAFAGQRLVRSAESERAGFSDAEIEEFNTRLR